MKLSEYGKLFLSYAENALDEISSGIHAINKLKTFESFLGYSPKIVMQANETNMVEGLVAAGVGIAIVPDTPLMNTNIFSKVKLKDATCSRSIYMAWNESITFS